MRGDQLERAIEQRAILLFIQPRRSPGRMRQHNDVEFMTGALGAMLLPNDAAKF